MSHEDTAVVALEVGYEPVQPCFYLPDPTANSFPFKRALTSVVLHSGSVAILMLALSPTLVLQPAIHPQAQPDSAGPMGLVALFAALAASTLLVPGLIHLLSERFTILFATVLIYPFVAINYLNLGTIGSKVAYYLLAVLAGLGCGAVFSAQAVYITRNSHISTIGRNFGILFVGTRIGDLAGNMISSALAKQLWNTTFLNHDVLRPLFGLLLATCSVYFGSTPGWKKTVIGPRGMGQRRMQFNFAQLPRLLLKLIPLAFLASLSGFLYAFSVLVIPRLLERSVKDLPYHWGVYGGVGIVIAFASGFLIDRLNLKFYPVLVVALAVSGGLYFHYSSKNTPANVYGLAVCLSIAQTTVDVFLLTMTAVAAARKAELAFPLVYLLKSLFAAIAFAFRANHMITLIVIGVLAVLVIPVLLYFCARTFDRERLISTPED